MTDEELLGLPDEGDFFRGAPGAGGRAGLRRRHRMLYPLLALLVFVALAPLGVLAWRFVRTNRETLATTQQEMQLLLTSTIAGQLDAHVDGETGRIRDLAGTLGRIDAGETGRADLFASLLDDDLIALTLVTSGGRTYEAHRIEGTPPPELGEAFREAISRVSGAPEGTPEFVSVSDPVLMDGGAGAAVVVAMPVPGPRAGPPAGVLAGVVDISRVWARILGENRTGCTVYAVDRQGRLFAQSDARPVTRTASIAKTEIVQRFLAGDGRRKETMLFTMPGKSGDAASWLGSYESTRLGWGIIVQVEERFAYAIIGEMVRDTLTGALMAVIGAVAIGILFASRLSGPVRRLTDAARRFAGGDFASRADVKVRNEIGELGETFNRMADDIGGYIRSLQGAARENNELFLGAIRALSQAIDAKDPYTRGHSARVAHYAVATGRRMRLEPRVLRDLYIAALLHDVGKIGIEDAILKKPAHLTNDEFEIMKGHPDHGARIMAKVDRLRSIIPGMRHHHERWGGGGYPLGLKGEEIPLAARIINVADSFDAMTTERPYSKAMSFEAGVARLIEIAGTQVDPKVVKAFHTAWKEGALDTGTQRSPARKAVPDSNLVSTPVA